MFRFVGFIVVMGLAAIGARSLHHWFRDIYEDAMAYRDEINEDQ